MSEGGVAQVTPEFVTAAGRYVAAVNRLVDGITVSRWRSALAIAVVALLCILPGFAAMQPVDQDEPNMATAGRMMATSGDLLSVPVLDDAIPARGPGVYWWQASVVGLFGWGQETPSWVHRVPSLLGAIAAGLLTWWLALAFVRDRAALLAGIALAASMTVAVEGRIVRPELLLLASLVLTQGALARLWRAGTDRRDWINIALFWTGLAASIAVGGLTAPLIVALTILGICVSDRSSAWLRRLAVLPGILWLAILTLPWLLTMTIGIGPAYSLHFFGWDTIRRFRAESVEFNAPPGFFLVLFFIAFWPAAAFVGTSVTWVLDNLRRPPVLFAIVWVVPFWFLCEAGRNKFPDLVLPAYPALALLAGMAIDEGGISLKGRMRKILATGPVAVPIIFLAILPVFGFLLDGSIPWAGVLLLLIPVVVGYVAWRQLVTGFPLAAFATSLVAAVALYATIFGWLIPQSAALDISRRAVTAARAVAACPDPILAGAGFTEPSLRFVGGDRTWIGAGGGAADFLAGGECRVAIVEARARDAFLSRVEDIGLAIRERGTLDGYDFARGRFARLWLYTVAPR